MILWRLLLKKFSQKYWFGVIFKKVGFIERNNLDWISESLLPKSKKLLLNCSFGVALKKEISFIMSLYWHFQADHFEPLASAFDYFAHQYSENLKWILSY